MNNFLQSDTLTFNGTFGFEAPFIEQGDERQDRVHLVFVRVLSVYIVSNFIVTARIQIKT